MSYASTVKKKLLAQLAAASREARAIGMSVVRSVVKDTPVLSGRLRGEWQTRLGSPATSVVGSIRPAEAVIAEAEEAFRSADLDFVVYFSNRMPYANAIENGHSRKHPEGMLMKNVRRVQALVAQKRAREAAQP